DIYGEAFDAELRSVDEAIAASGLAEKDLEPIRLVKRRIEEYHSGKSQMWKSAVADEVIDALKQWLSTSRRRGHRQYAGALLVAEAYSDVVALADGAGEDYVAAAKYKRAAPWARSMAIAHYRSVLRMSHSPRNSKRIWKQLWRLLAGAPPTGTNFLCVYD